MTTCEKIQENLAAEALEGELSPELRDHLQACAHCRGEAEAFRRLAASVKGLDMEDPGEIFFASQRKRIREAVDAGAPSPKGFRWGPALALAAAALLLFIGVSRIQEEKASTQAWSMAMLAFADGQGSVTGAGILELETLDSEQLEGLAQNMERRILGNNGDELLEDAVDWQDLSGSELDQLIQRLKTGTGDQA